MRYKPEQGRLARLFSFWLIWLLITYGCVGLRHFLDGNSLIPDFARTSLARVPVVKELTPNVLFALIFLPAMTAFVTFMLLNKPKIADFLIETEGELRKVAWPTLNETRTASIVVIITVLIFAAFLAGSDAFLAFLFSRVLS